MGEAAPELHDDPEYNEAINRKFELIVNDFFDGPDGPFFVQKWSTVIDVDEIAKQKPYIASGRQLLLCIFQQAGLVQPLDQVEELRQARNSLMATDGQERTGEKHQLFGMLDRLITINDVTRKLLGTAEDVYVTEYWDDYRHKTGQKTDLIVDLYDQTELYEECGLLQAVDAARGTGISQDIVLEADRLARIMIQNEID